jgi:hypothetical protein
MLQGERVGQVFESADLGFLQKGEGRKLEVVRRTFVGIGVVCCIKRGVENSNE